MKIFSSYYHQRFRTQILRDFVQPFKNAPYKYIETYYHFPFFIVKKTYIETKGGVGPIMGERPKVFYTNLVTERFVKFYLKAAML